MLHVIVRFSWKQNSESVESTKKLTFHQKHSNIFDKIFCSKILEVLVNDEKGVFGIFFYLLAGIRLSLVSHNIYRTTFHVNELDIDIYLISYQLKENLQTLTSYLIINYLNIIVYFFLLFILTLLSFIILEIYHVPHL